MGGQGEETREGGEGRGGEGREATSKHAPSSPSLFYGVLR